MLHPIFILDLFNDAQEMLGAFLSCYINAKPTDPQLIYDLQKKLDADGF